MDCKGHTPSAWFKIELDIGIIPVADRNTGSPNAAPILRQPQEGRTISLSVSRAIVVVVAKKHIAVIWPKGSWPAASLSRFGVSSVGDVRVSVLSVHDGWHAIDAYGHIAELHAVPAWHDGYKQQRRPFLGLEADDKTMSVNVYFAHRGRAALVFLHFKRLAAMKCRGEPRSVHVQVKKARALYAKTERVTRRRQTKGIVLGIPEFILFQTAFERNRFVFRDLQRFIAAAKVPEISPSVGVVVVHQQQRSRRHPAWTTRTARVVDAGEAPALVGARLLRKRGERNLKSQSPAFFSRLGRMSHPLWTPFPLNRAGDWQKLPTA